MRQLKANAHYFNLICLSLGFANSFITPLLPSRRLKSVDFNANVPNHLCISIRTDWSFGMSFLLEDDAKIRLFFGITKENYAYFRFLTFVNITDCKQNDYKTIKLKVMHIRKNFKV